MALVASRAVLQKLRATLPAKLPTSVISSPSSLPPLSRVDGPRRAFAAAAGEGHHHGTAKVNFWEQPSNPGNWKEEQFVLLSLSGWGLLVCGGYKAATGGKSKQAPQKK